MYLPKSQVKPNQYTNGGEFCISSNGREYKGPYFSTSKGEFYTGKNSNAPNSVKLKPLGEESGNLSNHHHTHSTPEDIYFYNSSYYSARNMDDRNNPPRNPNSSQVLPTEEDYKAGKYTKYFVSKTNEIKFIQVNKTEYLKFKNKSPEVNWTLYEPIELEWVIGGDRETAFLTNKSSVHSISTKYPGFGSVFKNRYDRFWRAK